MSEKEKKNSMDDETGYARIRVQTETLGRIWATEQQTDEQEGTRRAQEKGEFVPNSDPTWQSVQ